MAPSQLKQLKASLSSAGLIGPQKSKKQKAADQQRSDTRTVATKRTAALRSIRDQFNPYEVRSLTSRAPKHDVLRGISAARGSKARMITRPSQTKTLGEETRRRTLLVEMQNRHRVGGTTDQRFGDREADLGQRDLSQRNPSHQTRHTNNSSLFDLEGSEDDQDQMTHLGQRLPTAENDLVGYDDNEGPASLAFARPDRDERSGLKRKRSSDSIVAEQDMFTIKKSKNEVMKEVIAKSKLYKYERQQAKDEDEDVREELDRQLPDLLAAFSQGQAPVAGSDSRVRIDKSEQEYDEQVRQLAYDMRSIPTQKSKTEEEKGQERREHLQKLEEQRQARMRGEEPERVGKEDQDEDGLEDEDPTIFDGLGPGLSTHPMSNFLEDEDEFEIDTDLVEMEDLSEAEELEKSAFKTGDTHLDGMKSHRSVQASTLATIAPDETLDGFTPDPSSANAQQRITPIACPQDLPSLVALVKKAGKNGLLPTIQQIRLQYQAGSAETSSKQLAGFASLLVEYLLYHLAHYNTSPASDVDGLIRHLHSFAKTFPLEVAAPFRNWLTQILKRHPPLLIGEDIVAMKALGSIFPPSDHFHPLITPALLTMARFLEHCSVFPEDDCGAGTFISACCLDYQRIAKRYMPEVMAYFSCRLGPRAIERDDDFLDFEHIVPVLRQAANLWHDHPAFVEIFQPICDLLGLIVDPPAEMQDLGRELSTMVEQARLTRRPLTLHHHKPLAIKTAIPKFEAHFEPRRAFDPDQDRREASKLKAEYKRERKGAIRELRKDANFISREGLKEKKLKDAAYEKKYKRLVAEIQGEEGHEKNLYERDKRMRKKGGR